MFRLNFSTRTAEELNRPCAVVYVKSGASGTPASTSRCWWRTRRRAAKEKQLKTYFKTALSPCLTVMLSFKTESPVLAGTPAGTRNNNLSPRTTRHFPGIAKSPQIPMFLVCGFFSLSVFLSSHNFQGKTWSRNSFSCVSMTKFPTEAAAAPVGAPETDLDAPQVNGACYEICAVRETGAAHFANWLRVRAELRDPGGGEGVGGGCAPSSAPQTLMAVKWMLQPSLLLRMCLSLLYAPCLRDGLSEAASSQKAEFAAVLCIVKNLSLCVSLAFPLSFSLAFSQPLTLSRYHHLPYGAGAYSSSTFTVVKWHPAGPDWGLHPVKKKKITQTSLSLMWIFVEVSESSWFIPGRYLNLATANGFGVGTLSIFFSPCRGRDI